MWFTAYDEALHIFAQSHPDTIFWTFITLLGDTITLLLVVLILLLVLRKNLQAQIMLGAALLMNFIVVWGLKFLIARPRPDDATLVSYSFPSGHTLGATAVYGTIAYLLWKRNYWWQALTLLLIPLLVGISRIMLLEHWGSDVLGGWILGACVVGAAIGIAKLLEEKITSQASSSGRR